MKQLLAALASSVAAPTIIALAQLVFLPLVLLVGRKHELRHVLYSVGLMSGIAGGVAGVWLTTVLWSWIAGPTPVWMLVLLSILIAWNGLSRVMREMARFGDYCHSVGAMTPAQHRHVAMEDPKGQGIYRAGGMEIAWLIGDLAGIWIGGGLFSIV